MKSQIGKAVKSKGRSLICTKTARGQVWKSKGPKSTRKSIPATTTSTIPTTTTSTIPTTTTSTIPTTTTSTIPNCLQSGPCLVGSKGPGGGIVFYDAGSVQPWGRFLEVAPTGWMSGQKLISKPWGCKGLDVVTKTEIGSGKTNTELIVAGCSESDIAAKVISDLTINGVDDWFLPAKDELSALISSQKLTGVYSNYTYWTSSQASVEMPAKFLPQYAWSCETNYGECLQSLKTILGWGGLGLIPIRAFS